MVHLKEIKCALPGVVYKREIKLSKPPRTFVERFMSTHTQVPHLVYKWSNDYLEQTVFQQV